MAIQTIDPTSGEVLATFAPHPPEEVEARLRLAATAVATRRGTSFAERAAPLRAAADLLDESTEDLARRVTDEVGKPLGASRAEVAKCSSVLRYYAETGERALADVVLDEPGVVGARRALCRYEPVGVVLAIMPWNFPLWQVVRAAAPALMAGNVCLLKHAPNVTGSALALEGLFRRAGLPAGCFQVLVLEEPEVGDVIRDRRVAAVTLTGGGAAGRAVGAIAGGEVKRTVLELGGSDAFVVLPSADLDRAVAAAVRSRTQNSGQSCIAAKRFIVHEAVGEVFVARLVAGMRALRVGDPRDEATDLGPLATAEVLDGVHELVADAAAKGATVLCGGEPLDGPGWFYPPTVLAGITPAMRVHREEVFGPVATIHPVPDLDAAIGLANATEFGLGASVWTTDPVEQARCVIELEAGGVFVNGMTTSYPELPFGGTKRSGYGRELGEAGIRELCNLKTIWVGP